MYIAGWLRRGSVKERRLVIERLLRNLGSIPDAMARRCVLGNET